MVNTSGERSDATPNSLAADLDAATIRLDAPARPGGLNGLAARLLLRRPGRVILIGGGVLLGVALFTGALLTTTASTMALDSFIAETSGQADVLASAPGGSVTSIRNPRGAFIPAAAADDLAALPDVDVAFPALLAPTFLAGPGGSTEQEINYNSSAALVAFDFDQARAIYPFDLAQGRAAANGAEEVVLPPAEAEDLGAVVGDVISLDIGSTQFSMTVVGIFSESSLGRLDDAAFTSLATGQRLVDEPGVATQIALDLADGVDPAAWIDQHETTLPDGIGLLEADRSYELFQNQLAALNGALIVVGAALLFTAGFLIHLTMTLAVAERTRLYGTMQALGATGRQIRRMVLGEAAVLGIAAGAPGVLAGIGVAHVMQSVGGSLLSRIAGTTTIEIEWWIPPTALAIGVVVTVGSALLAARAAGRLEPITAIGTTGVTTTPVPRRYSAALALLIGLTGLTLAASTATRVVAILVVCIATLRVLPAALPALARAVGTLTRRLAPGLGDVAIRHLTAERSRSANTTGLVVLVVALTIAISAISGSLLGSLEDQLTAEFGNDLELSAATTFTDEFQAALQNVDGVAATTAYSTTNAALVVPDETEGIYLRGIDPTTYFDVGNFQFAHGSPQSVLDTFATGDAVLIPSVLAARDDLELGDTIRLAGPSGELDLPIAAIIDYSNVPMQLVVSRETASRHFGVTAPQEILVRSTPGTDDEELRSRIETRLGDQATFIVVTSSELKADLRNQIGGGINSFYVLLLLAAVVGAFGLANTLVASMERRRQEIGIIAAVGASPSAIRRMAAVEATTLVGTSLLLGIPLGLALSQPLFAAVLEIVGGLTATYRFPLATIPIVAIAALLTAIAASTWPAIRATRIDIDAALRND